MDFLLNEFHERGGGIDIILGLQAQENLQDRKEQDCINMTQGNGENKVFPPFFLLVTNFGREMEIRISRLFFEYLARNENKVFPFFFVTVWREREKYGRVCFEHTRKIKSSEER